MKTEKSQNHSRLRLSKCTAFTISLVFSLATCESALARVNLSSAPLFLKESVDPNLVFVFDDSGSMAWRFMPDDLNGKDSNYWYYSSHVNKIYYDPNVTYTPPLKPDGSGRYPNSSYTNAWVNGFDTSDGADNLSQYIRFDNIGAIEEGFYMQFSGTTSCMNNPKQNSCYSSVLLNNASAAVKQNYANWFSYYSTRDKAAKSGITEAFFDLPESIRLGYGAINMNNRNIDGVSNTNTLVSGVRSYTTSRRQNFLNWLHGKGVNGGTPLRTALQDVGKYYSRNDNEGPWGNNPGTNDSTDHIECRQSFSILMTDGIWNGANPGVGNVDNTNGPSHTNPDPDGQDYTYVAESPFSDTHSNTLADVASYYWKTDLRTDLANKVPADQTDPAFWQHMTTFTIGFGVEGAISESDVLDVLQKKAKGETADDIVWPQPYGDAGSPNIDDLLHAAINGRGGYASAKNPQEFTTEILDFLKDVIARTETSASSAAVSSAVLRAESMGFFAGFRSEDWSGTLMGYNFDQGQQIWDAEAILNDTLPENRKLLTHNGTSGTRLAFANASSISNLSSAQQTALNAAPSNAGSPDNLGYKRLAWLHGDIDADDSFRTRKPQDASTSDDHRLLGDIINANPQFAGKTNNGFARLPGSEGTSYSSFRSSSAYQNRTDALYVAANDGILHAFDGESGNELFGYIPGELLLPEGSNAHARISELMVPTYSHEYFLDGTPRIQDAYIDTTGGDSPAWKTILIGAMGAGGKTVFALDVTDPSSFSPDDVLWEFKHPNLGTGVTEPQIVRLSSGQWVAVFGNGYNGQSNQSSLFVVNLATGALIKEITTGVGNAVSSNGLAAPTITSFPETDAITRYAYAGDLQGNLWRFNLTGRISEWSATEVLQADGPAGNAQPITVAPRVALNPSNPDELVVAFGTGSFIRSGDEGDYRIQSLYGVIDDLSQANLTRDDLLEQTITRQESIVVDRESGNGTNNFTVRETSNNELTVEDGWYLDLAYNSRKDGERVISKATFPFGVNPDRVRFTTMIPDKDPCGSGRTGFIMDLKLTTGEPSETPVFDLNSDGVFNSGDITGSYAPSGIQVGYGGENSTITSEGGDTEVIIPGLEPGPLDPDDPCKNAVCGRSLNSSIGRQTWEQLR